MRPSDAALLRVRPQRPTQDGAEHDVAIACAVAVADVQENPLPLSFLATYRLPEPLPLPPDGPPNDPSPNANPPTSPVGNDPVRVTVDPITGKVLCACAAMGIARGVMRDSKFNSQQATDALVLLQQWIDDPIDERFDRICSLLFGVDAPVLDQFGVTGWSLRVATSSVGNYEAGWALSGTCEAALKAGYIPVDLCRFAELEIRSREDKSM